MMNLYFSSNGLEGSTKSTKIKSLLTYEALKIRIKIKAKKSGIMPKYSGSLWRGMIGKGLHHFSCINKKEDCTNCSYMKGCAYGTVFQPLSELFSPNLSGMMRYLPPPLIVEAPYFQEEKWLAGEECTVKLIVYGLGFHYLHYIIESFFQLAEVGVGKNRIPFEIISIHQEMYKGNLKELLFTNQINYDLIEQEKITFCNEKDIEKVTIFVDTPLRLQKGGEILDSIDLESFLTGCYRRVSILYEMKNEQLPFREEDLCKSLEEIRLMNPRIYWENWNRFSSKKRTVMNLGGLLGAFQLEGNLQQILPLLKFASYFHIGKQTVFGLGKFTLYKEL